jgi:uncharacterized protein YjbI with pentapeptide repeats
VWHKNLTSLQYGRKLTSRKPPQAQMTVVLRGTYRLAAGEPLTEIEDVLEAGFMTADVVAEDDLDRVKAITYPSDFADWKPNAEVMLRGTAYPPGGPDTFTAVGFKVGEWSKQLVVSGPRAWKPGLLFGASYSVPLKFRSVPLTWETAFGGSKIPQNPVGMGSERRVLPRVELPNELITSMKHKPRPGCFMPINPLWEPRKSKTGKNYGKKWRETRAPFFSDDFDWSYFCAAPEDQQLEGYLRGDEDLFFQNLHVRHSAWASQLPGVRVRHFVRYVTGEEREVPLVLDTLFADLEDQKLFLTWRGLADVAERDFTDITACLTASESLSEAPKSAEDYFEVLRNHEEDPLGLKESLPPDVYPKFMEAGLAEINLSRDLMGLAPLPPVPQPDPSALPAPSNPISALLREKLGAMRPELQAKVQAQVEKARRVYEMAPDPKGAPKKPFDLMLEEGIKQAQSRGPAIPIPAIPRPDLSKGTMAAPKLDLSAIAKTVVDAKKQVEASGIEVPQLQALDRILAEPTIAAAMLPEDAPEFDGQDLRERDFSGQDLKGASFVKADLRQANFSGADLEGADFSGAQLESANFVGAKAQSASFASAVGRNVDFQGARLEGAQFPKSDFSGSNFSKAVMTLAQLSEAKLVGAKLDGAELTMAVFVEGNLNAASFRGATVDMATFSKASLAGADLSEVEGLMTLFNEADLVEASFTKARLPKGSFEKAMVQRADFRQSFLEKATFRTAQAQGATFAGAELPGFVASRRADFTGAILSAVDAPDSVWLNGILDDADFSHADLRRAQMNGARCDRTRFDGAELREAALRKLSAVRARFVRANLCKTEFNEASIDDCDFSGANLYDTKFLETSLKTCQLDGALMTKFMMTEQR